MHDLVKDPVIPELNILGEIIDLLSSHCYTVGAFRIFYNSIGINFYRIVSLSAEKNVSFTIAMINISEYLSVEVNNTASLFQIVDFCLLIRNLTSIAE